MNQGSSSRRRHIISLVVVFLAGIAIGGSGTMIAFRGMRPPRPPMFERDPQKRAERHADRIAQRYDLDEKQREAITKIMYEHSQEAEAIIGKFEPELKKTIDALHAKIREVIPESKRAEFDEEVKMFKKNLPFKGAGGPPPPHGEGDGPGGPGGPGGPMF